MDNILLFLWKSILNLHFSGANADRLSLIGLCDDCRVIGATERAIDPYAGAERPRPRTAEDYRKAGDTEN